MDRHFARLALLLVPHALQKPLAAHVFLGTIYQVHYATRRVHRIANHALLPTPVPLVTRDII